MDISLSPVLIFREWSVSQLRLHRDLMHVSELAPTPLPKYEDRGKQHVHLTL